MPHMPTRLRTVFGKNAKPNFNDSFSVRTIEPSADVDTIPERRTVPIQTDAYCESLSLSPGQHDHLPQSFLLYPAYDQRYAYPDVNKNKEQEGEEEEEEEILKWIGELRFSDVGSTERTLQIARGALRTGSGALGNLEEQGYRLLNIKANMQRTGTLTKVGAESLRVLEATQMIPNPFKARQRTVEADSGMVRLKHSTRDKSIISRADSTKSGSPEFIGAKHAKYNFEDGDTDDEDEKKIGENLGAISEVVKELRNLASDLGRELEKQNGELGGIEEKVNTVTDGLNMNKHRMNRYL
jgi:hypothetical protein